MNPCAMTCSTRRAMMPEFAYDVEDSVLMYWAVP
jgi:hypothetical protein